MTRTRVTLIGADRWGRAMLKGFVIVLCGLAEVGTVTAFAVELGLVQLGDWDGWTMLALTALTLWFAWMLSQSLLPHRSKAHGTTLRSVDRQRP